MVARRKLIGIAVALVLGTLLLVFSSPSLAAYAIDEAVNTGTDSSQLQAGQTEESAQSSSEAGKTEGTTASGESAKADTTAGTTTKTTTAVSPQVRPT